jgi:predicted acyl esterase
MWGDSYYGYTQWAAVASEHPALKAIVPRVTSADLGGPLGPEGVVPLYMAEYLAMYWLDDHVYEWRTDYGHRPLSDVFNITKEAVVARQVQAASQAVAVTGEAKVEPTYGTRPEPPDWWADAIIPDDQEPTASYHL